MGVCPEEAEWVTRKMLYVPWICSVISEKLLDTSFLGLEFFLSQMSLLVTNVHGGCWAFLNALG